MVLFQVVLTIAIVITNSSCFEIPDNNQTDSTTLKLIHVLFRHGDRTNDATTTYPTDPHANETYFPYGVGQLTNGGKQREYLIGRSLRKRYDNFLGALYTPDVLDAISTEMNRTKMSLQLVLAGLYPPRGTELEWDTKLNWQPIPYSYIPFDKDNLLTLSLYYCSNYIKHFYEYVNSLAGQQVQQKYEELFKYLTKHTGKLFNSTIDTYGLYFGLTAQQEFGLELPDWTIKVYPKYLEAAAIDQYIISSATTKLKQLSGGFLVQEMIKNMKSKLSNKLSPQSRKLFLYSGHEINLGYVMNALEVYFPHIPPYGGYLLVELHEINRVNGVKIFYQDYSSFEPKALKVPGCDYFCPLRQFIKILQKNLPTVDMCEKDPVVLRKQEQYRRQMLGF